MTPKEFKEEMQKIVDKEDADGDREKCHVEADALLCKVLKQLGYGDGVKVFNDLGKWYA